MKNFKKNTHKGAFILIAIGMMALVSFLTTSELETLNIMLQDKKSKEYSQVANLAARSGIDYGYSMLKNVMESMSIIDLRFATHIHTDKSSPNNETIVAEVPPAWQEIINFLYDERARADRAADATNTAPDSNHGGRLWPGTDSHYLRLNAEMRQITTADGGLCTAGNRNACTNGISNPYEEAIDPRIPIDAVLRPQVGASTVNGTITDFAGGFISNIKSDLISLQNATNLQQYATFHRSIVASRPSDEDDFANDLMRDCPVERLLSDDGTTQYWHILAPEPTLSDLRPGVTPSVKFGAAWSQYDHCDFRYNVLSENLELEGGPALQAVEWDDSGGVTPVGYFLDSEKTGYDLGHLQTRRWHYYNEWDFQFSGTYAAYSRNIDSELNGGPGTGGTINRKPDALVGGLDFDANKEILFDRLINRSINYSQTLTYPYEPQNPREQYNVELQTVLDLDMKNNIDNEKYFDPTIYDNVRYKTFFKLWLTRDKDRDGYDGAIEGSAPVTSSFIPGIALKDYKGDDISTEFDTLYSGELDFNERPKDLHPIWQIRRDQTTLPMVGPPYSGLFDGSYNWSDTSYWRPDYARDFLDTNGNSDQDEFLGVLQFPMPYLSYQRGDVDYWVPSVRGDYTQTTDVAKTLPYYTTYSLWSLGEVKIVTDNLLNLNTPRAQDQILYNDFRTVARVLYRMDFHMDIRGADVEDRAVFRGAKMAADKSWSEESIDDINGPPGDKLTDNEICQREPSVPISLTVDLYPTITTNRVNEAYYASRLIPICDLDNTQTYFKHIEPEGISVKEIVRVPYRGSAL
ncbi:MAG: hypothetical protein KC646_02950 [Candidatus Cloacimonetes bacterium]|nr:hypothetical protein [Candidatus Cloacimonadota bacterium]